MKSILRAVAVAAALIVVPVRATAANAADKRHATALLKEGAKLLNSKDFAAALDKFQDAFRAVPNPKIQFNIGLALDGLDRPAEATRAYRKYLEGAPDEAAQPRSHARERLAALRARVTFLTVTTDLPGALVMVDGAEEGRVPLAEPVVLNPGPHQVVVQSPQGGAPWVRAIRGEPAGSVELYAKLSEEAPPRIAPPALVAAPAPAAPVAGLSETVPAPEPAPAPYRPLYTRGWVWGVAGGVVVAGVVAAVLLTRGGDTRFACPVEPCLRGGN